MCPVKLCKIHTYWHMSKYSNIGKKKNKSSLFSYSLKFSVLSEDKSNVLDSDF